MTFRPFSLCASALLAVAACAAIAACASNESELDVRFAPGFSPSRHAVSVFGVYKDGQMSAEAWDALSPRLASWLGGAACVQGYVDGATAKANGPLWSAVDDYTRSNGPTDDLLSALAPGATGDVVMVITVAGRVPEQEKSSSQGGASQPSMSGAGSSMGGMGGGAGGMRGGTASSSPMRGDRMIPAAKKDALDLAALFYSPSAKKSVAEVSIEYTGHSLDEGLRLFEAKLRESLPGASCAAWSWDGKVDADSVRKLAQ